MKFDIDVLSAPPVQPAVLSRLQMPVPRPSRETRFRYDVAIIGLDQAGLRDGGRTVLIVDSDLALLAEAELVLVCVPHQATDPATLRRVCGQVVEHVVAGQTIVLTSTSHVGGTREFLVTPLRERGFEVGADIFVAFAPERLDPQVPRVMGGTTEECVRRTRHLLSVHAVSSLEAAELTKLYENTFRAVNISVANEFADVSRGLGLDISEVIDAARPELEDPFWHPGADRMSSPLVEAAMSGVGSRPGRIVRRVVEMLAEKGKKLSGASLLVVGVAHTPGIADVRESPALEIIQRLRAAGASVSFTDALVPSIAVRGGRMSSVDPADITEWDAVLVHTLHPGRDHSWLADAPTVVDATYRLVRTSS